MNISHTALYNMVRNRLDPSDDVDSIERAYEIDGEQYALFVRWWQMGRSVKDRGGYTEYSYKVEVLFRFMNSSYESVAEFTMIVDADSFMFFAPETILSPSFMLTEIDYADSVKFGEDALSHHIMVLSLGG